MQRDRKRPVLLIALSGLTALALSLDVSILQYGTVLGTGIWARLGSLLRGVASAITLSPAVSGLLLLVCFWLYSRVLIPSGRCRVGECVLAAFLSFWSLMSIATIQTDSVSVLWANMVQLVKAIIVASGLFPLWLSVIRAADLGVKWLSAHPAGGWKHPFRTPWLILLASWGWISLIRFPSSFAPDTVHQVMECFGDFDFTAMNPPVHTLMLGSMVRLGDALGFPAFGMYLNTLMQMVALSCILAWLLALLQELRLPRILLYGMLFAFALLPSYAGYVTSVLKDTACSAAVLLFVICTALMVVEPELFQKHFARNMTLWALSAGLAVLMRKNGIGMVAPTAAAVGMYALLKRIHPRSWLALVCGTLSIVLALGVSEWVTSRYALRGSSLREVLSIPFQQTARVMRDQEVSPEEIAIINEVLDAQTIAEVYQSDLADPVKNTYREDTTAEELQAYMKLWLEHLVRYPGSYADASFGLTYPAFSPFAATDEFYDMNSAGTYYAEINDEWLLVDWLTSSPLSVFRHALHEFYMLCIKLPGIGLLLNTGVHIDLMLILGYLAIRRERKLWLVWLPALMCVGMLLFSPVVCTRYALPVFYCVPVMLALCCRQRLKMPA